MTPYDSAKISINNVERISIHDLLDKFYKTYKTIFIESQLDLMGVPINICKTETNFEGQRIWFECPLCKTRRNDLFKHPQTSAIACRECLNLEYESRL